MVTDPIADMLNKIKNAQAVGHLTVELPFSNLKYGIAEILKKQGFVEKVEKKGRKTKKTIEIVLKYQDKNPAISGIKKISKPGQRIYADATKAYKMSGRKGFSIISTSKGIMTNKEAKKNNLGGEVICEIW